MASTATTAGLSAPQIIEHVTYACDYTPFDVKWVPASAKVVIVGSYARGSGVIDVRELDTAALTSVRKAEKKDGFKCCTFGATTYEKRHLATGDYAGHVQTWDLERLDAPIFSVKGHSSIVNAIDGCGGLNIGGGAPEIVTGSRDGSVKVWDVRQTDPVASLEPAPGQTARDCWAVGFGNSFNDQDRVVCAGYDNGDVKFMCLRTNRLLWETNVNNGVVGVQFDRKDIQMNKMVVTTLESKFRVYDMRTFHPQEGYAHLVQQAHKSTVWLAKHLPQNRDLFMTTGGNGSLHLYQYHYPDQRAVKDENGVERGVMGSVRQLATSPISTQPIVGFDWHAENIGLACMASLDQNVRIAIVTKLAGR